MTSIYLCMSSISQQPFKKKSHDYLSKTGKQKSKQQQKKFDIIQHHFMGKKESNSTNYYSTREFPQPDKLNL